MFCNPLQELKLHYPKQHPTMSSKRSRVPRSSSLGEIGLSNHIIPIESPAFHWEKKRAAAAPVTAAKPVQRPVKNSKLTMKIPEQSRRSILTLASPTKDSGNLGSEMKVDERFGMFLRACGFCKKTINQNDDIFMYGYLGAFCSPECRDKQISLDEKQNKTSWASITVAENLVQNDMARRGFGAQVKKKYSVAKFK